MRLSQIMHNRSQKMNMKKQKPKIKFQNMWKIKNDFFPKSFDLDFGGVGVLRERKNGTWEKWL
jgi:hypothetical protein